MAQNGVVVGHLIKYNDRKIPSQRLPPFPENDSLKNMMSTNDTFYFQGDFNLLDNIVGDRLPHQGNNTNDDGKFFY